MAAATGATADTSDASDNTAPTAPTGIVVVSSTSSSVSIAWSPSQDNVAVTGYRVYLNRDRVGTTHTPSFTLTRLRCGRMYTVGVEARDAAGNRSSRTSVSVAPLACRDTRHPSAPTRITVAERTTSSITLRWRASSDNVGVVGYELFRAGGLAGTTAQTTYSFTGLSCGSAHTLAVRAYDAAGNRSASSSLFVATESCPPLPAPYALRVTGATSTSVSVAWSSTEDDRVVGYRVSTNGADAGTTSARSYTVNELPCGTRRSIAVAAVDAAGNRSAAASIEAETAPCPTPEAALPDSQPPSTPSGLAVASAAETQIAIRWTAATDNTTVAGYETSLDATATGTTTAHEYLFTGLTCGSSHTVAVRAVDAAGNRSGWTTTTAATSPCPDTKPPSAPAGLVQTATNETSTALSWQPSTDDVGVVGYGIYTGTLLVASTRETSFIFTGLSCGSTYAVAVDAVDAANNRSPRTSFVVTSSACPPDTTPPSVPLALTMSAATDTSISLDWGASTDNVGVAGYALYREGTKVATTSDTAHTYTGLTCGTSYTLAVAAYDASGNHSNKAHATTVRSTLACAAPSPQRPLGFSPGCCITMNGNRTRLLDEAVAAGIKRVRDEIWWRDVEKTPGAYDWTAYANFLNLARSKGVDVLYVIQNTPGWANGNAGYKAPPTNASDYGRFCGEAARALGPLGVRAFEVWNEPNIPPFWTGGANPAKYVALLKACYTAIKNVDSSIAVISAGLSPYGSYGQVSADGYMNPVTFLERMYANGAQGHFDALGWHPYSSEPFERFYIWSGWSQMQDTAPSARSLMEKHGDGQKRIWATEWGMRLSWCSGSETCQADRIRRSLQLWETYSWAGPVYFYNQWAGVADEDFSAARADWSKRPVWDVLASHRSS